MEMSHKINVLILVSLLFLIFQLSSCKDSDNKVMNYLNNAELQYEGEVQEENLITAMNDILNLSEEQLKLKKYKDYSGQENQWDLPTLIYKHFVPAKEGKTLGDNFYHDVKTKEVQKIIKKFLDQHE